MKLTENNESPTSIYNADERRLIAIASSVESAGRFIFGDGASSQKKSSLSVYKSKKNTILKSNLPHKVAVRNATKEHIEILGNSYIIDVISGVRVEKEYSKILLMRDDIIAHKLQH